jgi:hypothetical protein
MESTLQKPAFVAAKTTPKAKTIVYWIVTALFCLQMSFTAYAQLRLPQVAALIAHLSVGDGPEAWGPAAATGVLWGLSYFFWRHGGIVSTGETYKNVVKMTFAKGAALKDPFNLKGKSKPKPRPESSTRAG